MSACCRSATRCISAGRAISPPMPPRPGASRRSWRSSPAPRPPPLCGLVAGSLAIRRQGIYFAMITLALAQMMYFFALQAKFTGGEDGIQARAARPPVRPHRSAQRDGDVCRRPGDLPRRLPVHLPHRAFALRRGAQGDPRERAARHLARLQDRPLQAHRLRAVGDARRRSPARPRRSCCSSPR